jgi:hypothetical protein
LSPHLNPERLAYVELAQLIRPEFAVTLAPNRYSPSLESLRLGTKKLHAVLDRYALGRNFYRRASGVRSEALWFTEHLETNGHTHASFRVPAEWQDIIEEHDLLVLVREAYRDIEPFGTVSVHLIEDDGWSYYETKGVKIPSLGSVPWPTQSRTAQGRLIDMNGTERQETLAKIDVATQGIWLASEFHSQASTGT